MEVDCFECGCGIATGIWEDNVLSGRIVPICLDCSEEVPERIIWDVSEMNTEGDSTDHVLNDHPIPEGEDWEVVLNTHIDEVIRHNHERLPDDVEYSKDAVLEALPDGWHNPFDVDELYEGQKAIIYIRDPTDSVVLESARERARELLKAV